MSNDNNLTLEQFERVRYNSRFADTSTRHDHHAKRRDDIAKYGLDFVLQRDLEDLRTKEYLESLERKARESHDALHSASHGSDRIVSGLEELLKTQSVADVIRKFVKVYQQSDHAPIFNEFSVADEENAMMQRLQREFDAQFRALTLRFLEENADYITEKALLGYVKCDISTATFEKLLEK